MFAFFIINPWLNGRMVRPKCITGPRVARTGKGHYEYSPAEMQPPGPDPRCLPPLIFTNTQYFTAFSDPLVSWQTHFSSSKICLFFSVFFGNLVSYFFSGPSPFQAHKKSGPWLSLIPLNGGRSQSRMSTWAPSTRCAPAARCSPPIHLTAECVESNHGLP